MDNRTSVDPRVPKTDFDEMRNIANKSIDLCIKKDEEYGNSWRARGGVGAFFTVWRKADRLESQLKKVGFDIFNLDVNPNDTESIDETLKDLMNYLLLVIEARQAIYRTTEDLLDEANSKIPDRYSEVSKSNDKELPVSGRLTREIFSDSVKSEMVPIEVTPGKSIVGVRVVGSQLEISSVPAGDLQSISQQADTNEESARILNPELGSGAGKTVLGHQVENLSKSLKPGKSLEEHLADIKVDDFKIAVVQATEDGITRINVTKDGVTNQLIFGRAIHGSDIGDTYPGHVHIHTIEKQSDGEPTSGYTNQDGPSLRFE